MATDTDLTEKSAQTSYVFVRALGRGAFGEAVLYRKTNDNSLVVWKEVNLAVLSDRARKDAQNEIDILSLLNHANIVSYYNHFVDDDTLFIEMEYANGGSLHEKIMHSTQLLPEQEVLWYLFQISSALAYVHQYGIIHRDVKSQNIFLTKVGLLKLGDFGISKMLETKEQMADTVVGTPYYMSPELVKGERYNFKSDVWALGCVLYELLTLTRVFQASNALKLAFEIVQSEHESIDCQYSQEMHFLVNKMLQKEPDVRPSVEDILQSPLFSDASELERKVWELNSSSRKLRLSTSTASVMQPVVTSKMCEVYQWGGGKITPQKLEMFTREKSPIQVATGHFHFAAITFEKELYTWANPQGTATICGQLGHGFRASYKAPKRVDSLLGNPIQQVSCGEDFTLCVSDEGVLYGFGSNYYGCVGAGEEEEVLIPRVVDFFLDHPVEQVSCGDAHVVVLTRYGDVYTWGSGEFGKLGLDSEDDFDTPQKVDLPGKHLVKEVVAGSDGTFLVCDSGRLLACGSNEFNKLGFNSETSGLRKRKEKTYDIPCKSRFTTVKPLSQHCIVKVATGKTHSAAVDGYGHLFTFGSNRFGQLGLGDFRRHVSVSRVCGVLVGQHVDKVACGDGFTVITTSENMVYACGLAENGRLGADFSDSGGGQGSQCTASPRPIFGSMHIVPCLSSRHWNTLIIAEKVLNSKTLKTQDSRVSLSSPKVASGSAFSPATPSSSEAESGSWAEFSLREPSTGDCCSGDEAQTHQVDRFTEGFNSHSMGDSSIPPWLELELQEAEVIPLRHTPGSSDNAAPFTGEQPPYTQDEQEICQASSDALSSLHSEAESGAKWSEEERLSVRNTLDSCSREELVDMVMEQKEQNAALQREVDDLKRQRLKFLEALESAGISVDAHGDPVTPTDHPENS
ncbi:serine/threonine-protein kinase Nek9-like [Babylonia areolata]|uniref:serine/threonine-protein kinase Nek9-like n=1 Tax=Babylonia areolata TaxID=304850 RepID=UPI003FD2F00F